MYCYPVINIPLVFSRWSPSSNWIIFVRVTLEKFRLPSKTNSSFLYRMIQQDTTSPTIF